MPECRFQAQSAPFLKHSYSFTEVSGIQRGTLSTHVWFCPSQQVRKSSLTWTSKAPAQECWSSEAPGLVLRIATSHALSAFLLLGRADSLGRAEQSCSGAGTRDAAGDTLSPRFQFQFYAFVNHFNTVTLTEMQYKGEIKIMWSLLVWR